MAVGDEYLASVRHSVRLSSTVHDGELFLLTPLREGRQQFSTSPS